MKKIYLVGNPNSGKSVIFSRLTGVHTIASNYPGTTVEVTKGYMNLKGEKIEVIDVPGAYTLEPTNKAEKVAVRMLKEADKDNSVVINIIDSTKLERSLNLTLQLLAEKVPTLMVLNMWDEIHHTGISIDVEKLKKIFKIPVIPTCGITGEGIKELVFSINKATISKFDYEEGEKWKQIGKIIEEVQEVSHRHHTFLDRLNDLSIQPLTGIPIAAIMLLFSFFGIWFIGEKILQDRIIRPIFENLWLPFVNHLSKILTPGTFFHNILIGKLVGGEVSFDESMGILTTGLYVPIAIVLPFVFTFYIVLSFLEDSGYLPRLGILVDNLFHRVGLHGLSIVPMLLGLGCNVPGTLSTRILETRKERFISMTLMGIAIPCIAQVAVIVGLAGKYGAKGVGLVFGILFLIWLLTGIVLKKIIKGESPEIFTEIPPYRLPYFAGLFKKVWMRIYNFVKEAIPYMIFGVFVVNILYSLGIIDFLGKIFAPVTTKILGLPKQTISALLVGFLRKDVAVGMLSPLGLNFKQTVIGCVVLAMYFPCAATFVMLTKELGFKDMIKSVLTMITATLLVGGFLNLIM